MNKYGVGWKKHGENGRFIKKTYFDILKKMFWNIDTLLSLLIGIVFIEYAYLITNCLLTNNR